MSRKNLENLLDSMLDDGALQRAAEEQTEREERERVARQGAASARAKTDEKTVRPMQGIEELTGLSAGDMRSVLASAAPDDLLVLLATAGDVLQRRVIGNLSAESVAWLRQNLVHMTDVTNAERESAQKKVLKVANKLLADGKISLPEPESIGAQQAPDAHDKDLRELLTDIVRIAAQAGPDALSSVVESAGEPLLVEGLALVCAGKKGQALASVLDARRAELAELYARRLGWMEDALIAIAEGESHEAFRARLFSP